MHAGINKWCVLDTAFGDGRTFLTWLQYWQSNPDRPALLHYVGIVPDVSVASWPTELAPLSLKLGDGFHRLLLQDGQVSLTLCVGSLQETLSELVMQADTVYLGRTTALWDKWAVKALARLCRRHTQLVRLADSTASDDTLQDAGFRAMVDCPPSIDGMAQPSHVYDPRWHLSKSRGSSMPAPVRAPARCAVIGAGLAGASVAYALATRGWQVTVLDRHPEPAGGASGLPVGLVVPHTSADDSPRSRMSRTGTHLTFQHAKQLLSEGQDWAPSGVLERDEVHGGDIWHRMAGWIKPSRLVREWLRHPGITFLGLSPVAALRHRDGLWALEGETGHTLTTADHVVLANAFGCQGLLTSIHTGVGLDPNVVVTATALQELHGTLSYGDCIEEITNKPLWPKTPVNGNGSFIPHIPGATGQRWYAGSTFETDPAAAANLTAQHLANQLRLGALLPQVEEALADEFQKGNVNAWSGTRCVTHDRLPLVGPLQAGADNSLWISAGMGARGLSFSALCAQLLVAQMHGEPLPLEASLARGLSVQRARRQRSVRQTF